MASQVNLLTSTPLDTSESSPRFLPQFEASEIHVEGSENRVHFCESSFEVRNECTLHSNTLPSSPGTYVLYNEILKVQQMLDSTVNSLPENYIIQTPESDDDICSDSETDFEACSSSDEDLPTSFDESIPPPSFSLLSVNNGHPTAQNNNLQIPTTWNWVNDESQATSVSFPFTEEPKWENLISENEHSELDCFLEYFTSDILRYISVETNKYFEDVKASSRTTRRMQTYKVVTEEDVLRLIATRICMGLDRKPNQTDYWSANPFYSSQIVPKIMTSDRYKEVLRFLHFSDNGRQQDGDRLHKIRSVWNMVMTRSIALYTPGRNVCIDESLVLFKGKLHFKQYIPSKASKFGIKIFSIGDSATGYLMNGVIYQGAGHTFNYSTRDFGFGGAVALHLMQPYMQVGRCLFVDNYFTNAKMAKELLNHQTNLCGTLRRGLKTNPKFSNKQRKGDCSVSSCNGVLIERWTDKKEVRIISTGKEHEMLNITTKSGVQKLKPKTVLDYNKNARAIDLADMVIGSCDLLRKSMKWYIKIFFHLVDVCLLNARIMFRAHNPGSNVSMAKFKESVVRQILIRYGEHTTSRGRKRSHPDVDLARLHERHFVSKVPKTQTNKRGVRECIVCKRTGGRSQVVFQCDKCDVGLCPTKCFETHHTVRKY